jgi:flagellar biosynthesis protein FlhA
LVTKISSRYSVGQDLSKQFLKTSQPLIIAACVIASMAFVPGLPKIPFLLLGAGAALLGRVVAQSEKEHKKKLSGAPRARAVKQPVEELLDVGRVSVQVGVRLISMVDPRKFPWLGCVTILISNRPHTRFGSQSCRWQKGD